METRTKLNHKRFAHRFHAIDSHTAGEFTRVVLSGFPTPHGGTMLEKRRYVEARYDCFRRALMLEPRGHRDMFGAILTEPVSSGANIGVLFMDTSGFPSMCGHGTIGVATVAVETGLVAGKGPLTDVVLDTPAGTVVAKVHMEHDRVSAVTLCNVPSFLYREGLSVEVDGRVIPFDIAFGGSFFVLVDAESLGYRIETATVPVLRQLAIRILQTVQREFEARHPLLDLRAIDRCGFYDASGSPGATLRSVVFNPEGMTDRSPCGTGTSAKLAQMHAKGAIGLKERLINESFTGARFIGVATAETMVGPYHAIVPEITGSAYITGEAIYLLDERDPLKYGFLANI